MLKTQRWVPDTHPAYTFDCEWDYSGEPTFVRCFSATKNGVELADPDAVYALVLSENQTKNQALAALDGLDVEPGWVFGEADGVITITLPGATAEQIAQAQAALAQFGEAVTLG